MNQFQPFKLTPIFDIIITSKKNEKLIRREHKKMIEYYKKEPDVFFDVLITTKYNLESKDHLTESEILALQEIENLLTSVMSPEKYFIFSEEMLLTDFKQIYKQIRKKCRQIDIVENLPIEISFYKIADMDSKFTVVPDSKITIEKALIKTQDFLIQYQMFYN